MNLPALKIFLYRININEYLATQDNLSKLLSLDELQRASTYYTPQLRSRFCISHAILRKILARHTYTTPENIRYVYNEFNKPYLNQPQKSYWHFSMSYSQNITCYAVAQYKEIGIDIEHCYPLTNLQELIETTASVREQRVLSSLVKYKKIDAFYTLWTQKEALVKALGTGLSYPLNQLEVYNIPYTPGVLIKPYDNISQHPTRLYCKTIQQSPEFKISVASPVQKMQIIPLKNIED